MVSRSASRDFAPAVAIPPGETIRENMKHLGMSQKELAIRLGISQKHLSNIINGKEPITYETALRLEIVIGLKAQFWMNLETNYQLHKTRLERAEAQGRDLEMLRSIPYNDMSKLGWVEETSDRMQRVSNLRRFFGVNSLGSIEASTNVLFRKHKHSRGILDMGVLAWVRKAELEGLSVEVEEFDRGKLKKLVPTFRRLTMKSPDESYPETKRLCAEYGVALVIVESLPKTYICGATIWRNNKAILALSVRGKRSDIFWFTFFHELAHLINHSKKVSAVSFEEDADQVACDYLIPEASYHEFVQKYDYTDKKTIKEYAHAIGTAPCILVGRLLHDKLIDYSSYSDMRPPFSVPR